MTQKQHRTPSPLPSIPANKRTTPSSNSNEIHSQQTNGSTESATIIKSVQSNKSPSIPVQTRMIPSSNPNEIHSQNICPSDRAPTPVQSTWDFERSCRHGLACHGARSGACSRNHTTRLAITDTTQIPSGVCPADCPWNGKRCERTEYGDKCGFDHFAGYHQLREASAWKKECEQRRLQEDQHLLQQEHERRQRESEGRLKMLELAEELDVEEEYTGFEDFDKYDELYTVESGDEAEYTGMRSERAHQKAMEFRGLGTKKQVKAYEKAIRKH